MISVVVLTRNEEKNIERCLKAVSFCDEVLVIDDMSTDKTREIAKKNGARVFEKALQNDFAAQRNFGMSKALGDWILFIDADEVVTEPLKQEIVKAVRNDDYNAYRIRRSDIYWGTHMKHGEVRKAFADGIVRLVKKGAGQWHGNVHEVYLLASSGKLNAMLEHYPHDSIQVFLQHINFYSTLRAKELLEQGKKASIAELIFFPPLKFTYTYFFRLGFLDGPAGFCYSFMMSFHSFLVRAKLYQYEHFDER